MTNQPSALSLRPLPAAVEVCLLGSIPLVSLLYTPLFFDNPLAKLGLIQILAGVLLLLVSLHLLLGPGVVWLRTPVFLAFVAFLVVSLLSAGLSQNPQLSVDRVLSDLANLVFFGVAAHYVQTEARSRRLRGVLVATCVIAVGIGLLQALRLDPLGLPVRFQHVPVSTFGNPNMTAHYLDLLIPLLAAIIVAWWRSAAKTLRLALVLTLGLAILHMVLTESRAGWLSMVLGLAVFAWLMGRGSLRVPRRAIPIVLIGLFLLPVGARVLQIAPTKAAAGLAGHADRALDRVSQRAMGLFTGTDFSSSMRLRIWDDTLGMIEAAPLLGVGPGMYVASRRPFVDHEAWRRVVGERNNEPRHAHNEYLHVLAERGILGLVSLLGLFGSFAVWLRRRWMASADVADSGGSLDRRTLTAGFLGGLAASLAHALLSFNLHDPTSALHFWLFAGLVVGLQRQTGVQSASLSGEATAAAMSRPVRLALAGIAITAMLVLGSAGLRVVLGDFFYARAQDALRSDQGKVALSLMHRAVDWRPQEPAYLHALGQQFQELGKEHEAESWLRRALALNPNDAGALRLLGRSLIRQGDSQGAIPVLDRAVLLDPFERTAYSLLAQAYRQSGKPERAMLALGQARERLPFDPNLLVSQAHAHREAGRLREAISLLDMAARWRPDDGAIRGNLGSVHLAAGNLHQAEAHLRRAMRLDATHRATWATNLRQALLQLSQARFHSGRPVEARALEAEAHALSQ